MKKIEIEKPSFDTEYQKEILNTLMHDQDILHLLVQQDIPKSCLEMFPSKFLQFQQTISKCHQCQGLDFCAQKLKGYYESLAFDGVLNDVIVPCDYQKKMLKETAHLQNYLINDMPNAFYTTAFQTLNLANETSEYGNVVTKVMKHIYSHQGVFLYGRMGCGKSYLASCITNHFAREGKYVCYVYAPNYKTTLLNQLFTHEYVQQEEKMKYCDCLVIDDIGAEENTQVYSEHLLSILDYRMQHKKLTCFTSNDAKDTLLEHFSIQNNKRDKTQALRILERIEALSTFIPLNVENRRVKL